MALRKATLAGSMKRLSRADAECRKPGNSWVVLIVLLVSPICVVTSVSENAKPQTGGRRGVEARGGFHGLAEVDVQPKRCQRLVQA